MTLENLWAGWRHEYVTAATADERPPAAPPFAPATSADPAACVFCRIAASGSPSADNLVIWRDDTTLAVLNLYPYASGHVLVMPVRHLGGLAELDPAGSAALWECARAAAAAIEAAYHPDGLNLGANLGRAAGAGIPAHLHLHVVPRWAGDTNFMTAVSGTRVMPQPLAEAWELLRRTWPALTPASAAPPA